MPDATTQLEEIKARIDALVRQAAEGELYLPEVGRVKIMGLMLDGVLMDTRKRDRRAGAVPMGGMDNSVPAGDRA
ncbi:hypothetical protein [Pseudodesulfovibrio karagichevae]|uniref:Uncharacterized protein n=1 Tax=Pseudodesulfovibrio karagichevae TaxID=3239305 RepID=A0ABV4K261_9BACT